MIHIDDIRFVTAKRKVGLTNLPIQKLFKAKGLLSAYSLHFLPLHQLEFKLESLRFPASVVHVVVKHK